MDLITPNPTASKSHNDAANDLNPLSSTNGAHYKHPRRGSHQPPAPPPTTQPSCSSNPVTYRECLKNHAASLGGHAVDGCGEFMPSHSATPTEPASLKCAACGCHRNFHRRELDSPSITPTTHFLDFRHHDHQLLPPAIIKSSPSPSSSPSTSPPPPHMLLSLSIAATEDHQQAPETPTACKRHDQSCGRKRTRTKFSQDQKEKMYSFSEKLGWKLQKSNEAAVEEFCSQIGVSKGVLKVWMHNNKNTYTKRDFSTIINNYDSNSNRIFNDENRNIKGSSSSS